MYFFQASPGELVGYLVFALILCAVLAVVILVIAKKDNAKLDDLLASTPEDKKEALKAEEYQPLDSKGIKCATRGLLVAIHSNGDKSNLQLLFYNAPRDSFYNQPAKIRTSELNGKGYKMYDFVPCEMKYDKEMHIHMFKKIM